MQVMRLQQNNPNLVLVHVISFLKKIIYFPLSEFEQWGWNMITQLDDFI